MVCWLHNISKIHINSLISFPTYLLNHSYLLLYVLIDKYSLFELRFLNRLKIIYMMPSFFFPGLYKSVEKGAIFLILYVFRVALVALWLSDFPFYLPYIKYNPYPDKRWYKPHVHQSLITEQRVEDEYFGKNPNEEGLVVKKSRRSVRNSKITFVSTR